MCLKFTFGKIHIDNIEIYMPMPMPTPNGNDALASYGFFSYKMYLFENIGQYYC